MQLAEAIEAINKGQRIHKVILRPNAPWRLYTVIIERSTEEKDAIALWAKAVMNSTCDGDNFFRAVDPDIAPWEKGNIMWNW